MTERPGGMRLPQGAVAVAVAVTLMACGGDDEGGGESDEDAVRAAFAAHAEAVSEGDVDAYCEGFSETELERTGIDLESCLDLDPSALRDETATEATITSVTIEGDEATVEYELSDGTTETGTIVQEDGEWKVSDLTFF